MLDCLQCSNHDSSQEISVYSNSHSYLSTSYNNISVIFMSKLYGHKSTRTVSSGCFRIGFSCSIYSRGITKSFTELCLMWSSTLSPLPSLYHLHFDLHLVKPQKMVLPTDAWEEAPQPQYLHE